MTERLAEETQSEGLVLERLDEGILTLTLNRAPANLLSLSMIDALSGALDRAAAQRGVRVIVIASGARLFCAGHDLKEMRARRTEDTDGGRAYFERLFADCAEMMKRIVRHRRPVIAAVDGMATAAGCQLVASCDLAIASERAAFATPGVNIGGFCSTPMVALSRNINRKQAMEMLLTGEPVDARRALEIGLVNRVVPQDALIRTVSAVARSVASKSASAIARGKRAFYRQADMPLAEAYEFATEIMVDGFMTADSDEGIDAFIAKRPAKWRH